jgi:uncharacterized protein (TIGR02757 family)
MGTEAALTDYLDVKAAFYNKAWFIQNDPISIPHRFTRKEDIEISGFLTATLAWGQRPMILKKAGLLMSLMEDNPHDFITQTSDKEFGRFKHFVYRTFNGYDCSYFMSALRGVYLHHGGLEPVFEAGYRNGSIQEALSGFRKVFLSYAPMSRTGKHVADVDRNSSAKRLNMFLRWMVRQQDEVDFGLWTTIDPGHLMIPLDVHVGRVARQLGLLTRKQDDWKAVEELTAALRCFRPHDPVYYDFALFGLGVYEARIAGRA